MSMFRRCDIHNQCTIQCQTCDCQDGPGFCYVNNIGNQSPEEGQQAMEKGQGLPPASYYGTVGMVMEKVGYLAGAGLQPGDLLIQVNKIQFTDDSDKILNNRFTDETLTIIYRRDGKIVKAEMANPNAK